jgi:hypothetical protein
MCQILLFRTLESIFMDAHMQRKTFQIEQLSEHQILQAFVNESNFFNLPF